jgi:hypothetical protein
MQVTLSDVEARQIPHGALDGSGVRGGVRAGWPGRSAGEA